MTFGSMEERIRAATRALGQTWPAEAIPPLRLPEPADETRRVLRFPGGRRHGSWTRILAPAAAAAAVAAVAISLSVASNAMHARQAAPAPAIQQLVSSGALPPYYLRTTYNGNHNMAPQVPMYAEVRATATGSLLGTIRASKPGWTILGINAAGDDRTFVLAEAPFDAPGSRGDQTLEQRALYLVRLNSRGVPGPPSRVVTLPAGVVNGVALSADGSRLSVVQLSSSARLSVYTLATGTVRTWSANGAIGMSPDDERAVSWSGDGRHLLFSWENGHSVQERLLDTSLGSGNLLTDSRLVFTVPVLGALGLCQGDVVITPDGTAAICPALTGQLNSQRVFSAFFREYSTASPGQVIRQLGGWTISNAGFLDVGVLWSNRDGTLIIGTIPSAAPQPTGPPPHGPSPSPSSGNPPPGSVPRVGVISGNGFIPLDLPGASDAVW